MMMLAAPQNPLFLTRKTPLSRVITPSHSPHSVCSNSLHLTGFGVCTTSSASSASFNSSRRRPLFKDLGSSEYGLRQLGRHQFRVSAVSGGGSGDTGGIGGSGGDENSGDGADGNNWSLLLWYLSLLAKYPVLTKAVTSGLLNFLGDVICQLVIDKAPSLDFKRTSRFAFLGLVLVGPALHFWYLYLSKLVTIPGAAGAFTRLVLDQFIFAPVFLGLFLSTLVVLEGRPSQVVPKLQQELFSSVVANWQLWIPFQFLNFRFMPQQFQVLGANVIALVWNVIFSFKAHKEILLK
ncbi:Protein sym-1 [Linum perenne]